MGIDVWLVYVAAIFVVIVIPGPLSLLMVSNVINFGLKRSLPGIAGGVSASLILLTVSALGLGALIVSSLILFNLARYAGAAYLVWLGMQSLLTKVTSGITTDESTLPNARPATLFRRAFLLGISNPKDILFFIAFLPQFIDAHRSIGVQLLVMVASWTVVDVACKLGYGSAAKAVNAFLRSVRGKKLFNGVTGVFFIGTALSALLYG
ncbi:LysE family translocator [Crenobacter sp. SG2305]|uniref:LysE family translocator n=1 Tax=Crenobacter oryzisoli TaxID=3056844 RepID=UPI0025AAEE45|nr:LysE family translocator [Crenobacter sp. SG2305]MDN0081163.1 LysE family translocator [Crenobacter sp. SG2305]